MADIKVTPSRDIPPLQCPQCAHAVYRLTMSGRWARWRARLTKRRPYACAVCGWQGTLVAAGNSLDVIDQLTWFRAREPQSPAASHHDNSR